MTDTFPNELVEAAANEACAIIENRCGTVRGIGPAMREALAAVLPLIEQRARLDERERLSSRVHENGWCPTCARDTDEAAMQRLAGKPVESLSRTDLIGLALRNLSAAMDAEARAAEAEQRVIDNVIDRLAAEAGSKRARTSQLHRIVTLDVAIEAVREAAACGVAAERARCPLCDHEWRRHDPEDGMCDCHDETAIGPCRCGRDLAWVQERIAAMSSAALAPERTGEGA